MSYPLHGMSDNVDPIRLPVVVPTPAEVDKVVVTHVGGRVSRRIDPSGVILQIFVGVESFFDLMQLHVHLETVAALEFEQELDKT